MWILRWSARENDLLHCAHLCDFFPEWVSLWSFRCSAWSNVSSHWSHLKRFSLLLWVVTWFSGVLLSVFEHNSSKCSIWKDQPCAKNGEQILKKYTYIISTLLCPLSLSHLRRKKANKMRQCNAVPREIYFCSTRSFGQLLSFIWLAPSPPMPLQLLLQAELLLPCKLQCRFANIEGNFEKSVWKSDPADLARLGGQVAKLGGGSQRAAVTKWNFSNGFKMAEFETHTWLNPIPLSFLM